MLAKRYKLPVIGWISYEDLMYSMVIIVNIIINLKVAEKYISNVFITKKEIKSMWFERGIK